MNTSEFERDLFNKLAAEHGRGAQSLNYGSEGSKMLRACKAANIIESLVEERNRERYSLVDVGCGFCDLYRMLDTDKIMGYTGVDISSEVLRLVDRSVFHASYQLVCADYFLSPEAADCKADIVASIGALNYDHDIVSVMQKVAVMYRNSVLGTVFTLSSSHHPAEKRGTVAYWNPTHVYSLCTNLTPYIRLDHDYHDGEFIVSLMKDRVSNP